MFLTEIKYMQLINDRLDIAIAIDADGVHIGQDDMPAQKARQILGEEKIIGVSASTIEEAKKAEADGADYIGTGAVFPTATKDDAPSITKDDLNEITSSISIPTVAIGGITLENAHELKDTGIAGFSVVSAIMSAENPKEASEKLGTSAIKYFDLKQFRTTGYRFDFNKMLDDKGNTAVYLFYSYVRICSIYRKLNLSQKDIDELVKTKKN